MIQDSEKQVLEHLSRAYSAYLDLGDRDSCDDSEACEAVHRFQNVLAMRVARRADPAFWKLPDGGWAPIHGMAGWLRDEATKRLLAENVELRSHNEALLAELNARD